MCAIVHIYASCNPQSLSLPPFPLCSKRHLRRFIADLKSRPIAQQTAEANEQHYEVDTRFYNLVLGKHRKYSSALYPDPANMPVEEALAGLDDAESAMLEVYAKRAQIKRGGEKLRVLDLGCGWGSVTLWFAANFPQIDVVGFSNSRTQRALQRCSMATLFDCHLGGGGFEE